MVRRYYRRRPRYHSRRLKTIKYSVENFVSEFPIQSGQQRQIPIINPTNITGVRKIKNFTLTVASETAPVAFALVFVPEGTQPSPLNFGNNQMVSFYEPNQNVIIKGAAGLSTSPSNYFSRLSRNLNSGDTVYLVYKNLSEDTDSILFITLSYAIAFT